MKAVKLCENAQLKNLSTTELNNNNNNNNGPSNGKSANSYVKTAMSENLQGSNGDVLSDKSKAFKQRISSSSSTSSAMATDENAGDRITSRAAAAAAAAMKKSCSIENFLSSSNVPNAAATAAASVETARNGFLAAAAAAQQFTPFNLFTPYLKDMFFAAQLLRGKTKYTTPIHPPTRSYIN